MNIPEIQKLADEIQGIMYANKTDEADEGSWIDSKDFYKVSEIIAKKLAEYGYSLAPQSNAGVWVKASERLPERNGVKSPNGFYFCKCTDDVVDVCQYKEGWNEFRHTIVGCDCKEYSEEKADVIEWLDESPSSSKPNAGKQMPWKDKQGRLVFITPDDYKIASLFYSKDSDKGTVEYYDQLAKDASALKYGADESQSNAGVSEEEIKRLAEEILFKDYGINAKNFTYSPFKDFLAAMVEMYQSASKPKDNELLEALKEMVLMSNKWGREWFPNEQWDKVQIAKEAIAKHGGAE